MYGKEIGSERASNQKTEKIRLLFSRERERERVFSRVFGGGGTERGVRDCVVCVVVSSKRALKGKETVCAPKRGLFLSVSDFFLESTQRKREIHF
jgi:hypothetical protein